MDEWGMWPQRQSRNGCVKTCMAILLGLTQEHLPTITFECYMQDQRPMRKTAFVERVGSEWTDTFWTGHGDVVQSISWDVFKQWWKVNGVRVRVHHKQPDVPSMRVVGNGAHVVVHMPDGRILPPETGRYMNYYWNMNDTWITAEWIA